MKVELSIAALPIAARLLCKPVPRELSDILQQVFVVLQLVQAVTGRVLGEGERSRPIQVTANSPGDELHHTSREAELLILLARPGRSLESSPLNHGELSRERRVFIEIYPLLLTQSLHVPTGPELVPLVQVDLVPESVVM